MNFDYNLEPGRLLKDNKIDFERKINAKISIITPFYNTKKEIFEYTFRSVMNQTYPYFEWIIVNDGSTSEETLNLLGELESRDSRIKVYHKENSGLAQTRDFGAKKTSKESKYLVFLDDDDEISETFIECAYWTLETNENASWAYADSLGFGEMHYLWRKWYYPLREKNENQLIALAMIRKNDYLQVGGYEINEKSVFEDWNFWLKLIAAGKYPVRMSYIALWYRRKKKCDSELARANANRKKALKYIKNTSKDIKTACEGIQYPRANDVVSNLNSDILNRITIPKLKENTKIKIMMIIPWMVTGGADRFNYELIKKLDKDKYEFIIVTTIPCTNEKRQKFEEYATVYDLTTFLDKKYWIYFLQYLIEKYDISIVFNTNSKFGYYALPYIKKIKKDIKVIDYIHMEEKNVKNGGFTGESKQFDDFIDKTLVCNDQTKNVMINDYKKASTKIQRIYIGVDEEEFDPRKYDKMQIAKNLNINIQSSKVIGYICRIENQKRPFLFVEIVKELNKIRNDLIFVVAGKGELLNKLEATVNKEKIKNIKFLNNVEKVQEIYSICDVTLNCSIKEGIALTSYESLSMGVPVVSADVGGQKELLNENVGVIVKCRQKENEDSYNNSKQEVKDYVQAIEKILNEDENYKKNCRERILENYSINRCIQEMDEVFSNIIKKNKDNIEQNTDVNSKEIILDFYKNNQDEYMYFANKFIKENVDRDIRFEKTGVYYEGTIEYKIKHVFYVILERMGIYKYIKKFISDRRI